MAYVKFKDVFSIVDTVSSDEGIRRKCKAIRKRLKKLPGEDVEKVVRCKDCTIYNGHRYCTYFECTVFDDDFCSYGKRKEGAEE